MHGLGKLVHSNGDIYEGQWENNKANGYGKYINMTNQAIYEGSWVDDLQ